LSPKRALQKRSNDYWFLATVLRALLTLWDSEAQMFSVLLLSGARGFGHGFTVP
jgi:hypothetical protein